ncbi:MAG: glycosyl hydrolase-related protein [Chloroflexota bacterium]
MSDTPPLKRASYVLHVCSVAGLNWIPSNRSASFPAMRIDVVKPLDEALDLFDDEPRFQHFTLDGETFWLEEYLSIRPENFERVEAAVQAGQLLIGPWYIQPDPKADSELLIRNLMIGLRTARVFGQPMLVGYLPHWRKIAGQLPQILKGFGINSVIVGHVEADSLEVLCTGIDGTQIIVSQLRSPEPSNSMTLTVNDGFEDERHQLAPYSQSGHLLLIRPWYWFSSRKDRLRLFQTMPTAQMALHDDVFHSNPAAYAKAIQANREPLSEVVLTSAVPDDKPADWTPMQSLEMLSAWVENMKPLASEWQFRHPQTLLQTLWKTYLRKQRLDPDLEHTVDVLMSWAIADIANQINTWLLPMPYGTRAHVVFNPTNQPTIVTVTAAKQTQVAVPALSYVTINSTQRDRNVNTIYVTPYTPPARGRVLATDIHEGSLPLSASIISVSEPNFHISTVKLPEDADRGGMIVRGTNQNSEAVWVTLTPWRPFATVEVVTLDESPTGGKLAPESEGAVRFYARPHGILTLWFHD